MPLHEQHCVRIDGATVVWDGITRPDPTDQGGQRFSLKVVIPPTSPDVELIHRIGMECLQQSKWRGTLPGGANWLCKQADQSEFNGMFPGWWVVNASTYQPPQVFDENGREMQAMQYGNLLYQGQKVNVLVSARDYDQKSKGIKCQLEGFQIVASANAPRINCGGSSVNAASAFGGAGPAAQPAQYAAPGYGPQPTHAAPGYGAPPAPNQYQPPAQGGYPQNPQNGGVPYVGAPSTPPSNVSSGYAPPASTTTSPSDGGGYPQQQNYLPQR